MAGHYSAQPYIWNGGINGPHVSRYFMSRGWVMPGEVVIDAACGSGYGSHLIAQYAGKVIGLDRDPDLIDSAIKDWGEDKIDFRTFHMGEEEWPDADVLISIESLEHVNGLEHALDQITKHIKRMCFICVPIGGSSHIYSEEQLAGPAGENNDFFTKQQVEQLFTDRGWKLQWDDPCGDSHMFIFFKKEPIRP